MTSDPARPLSSIDGWGNPTVLTQGLPPVASATENNGNGNGNGNGHHAPAAGVEQLLTSIYAQVLDVDRVGSTSRSSTWAAIRCRAAVDCGDQ